MSERPVFAPEKIYHLYNRGVAKQPIFTSDRDRHHFLELLSLYRDGALTTKPSLLSPEQLQEILVTDPQEPLVDILAYCLMPNHFHLLVRQVADDGVTRFMRRSQNSYVHYYNLKHDRVGPLFQGRFQAVVILSNEQLLHVSRYIHLNPMVARLASDLGSYHWSSFPAYVQGTNSRLCETRTILGLSGSHDTYEVFVRDYADYAIALHDHKDFLLDL